MLLLDDLQWADNQTVAALAYLRRRGNALPAAVVTTARSTEGPSDHPQRHLTPDVTVRLEPLSPSRARATRDAPAARLDRRQPSLRHRCARQRAAGRPLADARRGPAAQCRAEATGATACLSPPLRSSSPSSRSRSRTSSASTQPSSSRSSTASASGASCGVDGLRFRFRYDLVRQVLLESISPARRRLLRRRLDGLSSVVAPVSPAG